jgi:hypothetical protein
LPLEIEEKSAEEGKQQDADTIEGQHIGKLSAESGFQTSITEEIVTVKVESEEVEDLSDHDRLEHAEYNGYSSTDQTGEESPFVFYEVLIKRGQVFHIRL